MRRASAPAKINLALVVGPAREGRKHEVATVLQRIDLADRLELHAHDELRVDGFGDDTLVRRALEMLADAAGVQPRWRIQIEKRIPVAAGLAGGSSDAATALQLANATLDGALPDLHPLAAALGADVPFFLAQGPQLGTGDGSTLTQLELPQDYWIVLALPRGLRKRSTAAVYEQFEKVDGFEDRKRALMSALDATRRPSDLRALPPNDLASSPLAEELRAHGAFRADVSGAGPAVYGLFLRRRDAEAAAVALRAAGRGRVWVTAPAWYG